MDKSVLLLSGGLDSGSLLFWAINHNIDVYPLFINYGQVTFPGEWRSVKLLIDSARLPPIIPLHIPKIATLGSGTLVPNQGGTSDDQYFPSRNLLLISIASMYAYRVEANSILIGLIGDTAHTLPDCSEDFIIKTEDVLKFEYPLMNIRAPYIQRTKVDIVREAINYGLMPEMTFCCNRFANRHCWTCPSCRDRFNVFSSLNII